MDKINITKNISDMVEVDFVVRTCYKEQNGDLVPAVTHKMTIDATDMSFNGLMEQFKNSLELAGYEFPVGSYISLVRDVGEKTLDIAKDSNVIQFRKK